MVDKQVLLGNSSSNLMQSAAYQVLGNTPSHQRNQSNFQSEAAPIQSSSDFPPLHRQLRSPQNSIFKAVSQNRNLLVHNTTSNQQHSRRSDRLFSGPPHGQSYGSTHYISNTNRTQGGEQSVEDPLLLEPSASTFQGNQHPYYVPIQQMNSLVSYNRFKNTSGVTNNTGSVRRSLNEMTQQVKKSKEMHELMLERKNIENMIVNSKLWSPPGSLNGGGLSTTTHRSSVDKHNATFTTNVFSDKRDELTKILKKRLNYIHQQSSQNQTLATLGSKQTPKKVGTSPGKRNVMLSPSQYKSTLVKNSLNQMSSADPIQSQDQGYSQGLEEELVSGSKEIKLPTVANKTRQSNMPGKGGNPFMIRNGGASLIQTQKTLTKQQQKQDDGFIKSKRNGIMQDPLEAHVDAVINDESFKRGLQEQITHSVQLGIVNLMSNATKLKASQTFDLNTQSTTSGKALQIGDTHATGSTSLQRQMVFQSDLQMKFGQINKRLDEEIETVDQALEHLKLKKPHQFGLPFQVMASPTNHSPTSHGDKVHNPFSKLPAQKTLKKAQHEKSESANYVSVIKSQQLLEDDDLDLIGGEQSPLDQLDMIQAFAFKLMRQRKALDGKEVLARGESFNTEMGMAFSAQNELDYYKDHMSGGGHQTAKDEDSDLEGATGDNASDLESPMHTQHPTSQNNTQQNTVMVLETERGIKHQEGEFVKKVQNMMINEFSLSGTAHAQRQLDEMESLYLVRKKKQMSKRFVQDEVPTFVEEYMKTMKTQTLEALTQDVKARNQFFQFIRYHQNAMFGEKFKTEPKLNYFLKCNKECVTALPTISKIQGRALNLMGYGLNEGVCKAMRLYLENFRTAINRISLDNNGAQVLAELFEGVRAQEDFKQIIIIRNSIDEHTAGIIVEILQRGFPKALEELRIINCKISPMSTHKILSIINDGKCSLRKLSLAGAGVGEQSLLLLAEALHHVRSLIDLDISWNGFRPNANFKKFLDSLGANRSLSYLNLSWNNLMIPAVKDTTKHQSQIHTEQPPAQDPNAPPQASIENTGDPSAPKKKPKEEKLDEYTQHLMDNMLRFIKYNKHLIHLDLSHCGLDRFMIKQFGTALRRAKSLVAVHFTGNPGVVEDECEYLHKRVHCRAARDLHTKKESLQLLQNMQSPRQNKAFDGIQLKVILQKQKMVKNVTGGQSFKPQGDEEGNLLQFQRWLGHKFDIPRSGQWQMNSAWNDIRDQCWVCHKWCYTLIYWSPTVQNSIIRTHTNPNVNFIPDQEELDQVRALLRPTEAPYEYTRGNTVPLIAGSFTNWEVREMIPLVSFCEAIDSNKPDPIAMLKKQGRVRDDAESEADLKTDKEKYHLQRMKEQIRQEYRLKWKQSILKSLKYKRAFHHNLDFASEVDTRREEIYVFATFGYPGQHVYWIKEPMTTEPPPSLPVSNVRLNDAIIQSPVQIPDSHQDLREYVNKCIIPMREEDIPIYEKVNKFKVQSRVFKKEHSVFKDWKEDTPATLTSMFNDDIKWYKIGRFIKDEGDKERTERVLEKHFLKIKKIFTSFISQSMFPNISWIDFGNFCERCKIIDGKGVTLSTVDRAFIAANVAVEGQKLSEDNPTNALSRFEFLEILTRLAHSKFVETKICPTYEEAMTKLLEEHIFPYANPEPWQEFRDEQLWSIEVNDVLEVNLEGLKKVYTNYHEPRKKFMTMNDAMSLMMKDTSLGLIEKDAIYCFGMCKMSVIFEQENMWQYKQLKFVELLELMGRIAYQKFKDHPELHDSMSLAQKIEHVLDVVLKMVGVERKDVQNNVVEESESDDDY